MSAVEVTIALSVEDGYRVACWDGCDLHAPAWVDTKLAAMEAAAIRHSQHTAARGGAR